MAIRYVKDFEFPSSAGYTKSAPSKVTGPMFAKGGKVEAEKAPKGLMVVIGVGKPKGEVKKSRGGPEYIDKGPDTSVPVKGMKGTKNQSTDEDFYGKAKDMPMPTRRPAGMKKGGMKHDDAAQDKAMIKSMVKPAALKKAMGGQAVQMAKSNAVEASMKGQKKMGYADGGMTGQPIPADIMSRYAAAKAAPQGPLSKMTLADGRSAIGERQVVDPKFAPQMKSMGMEIGSLPAGAKSVPVAPRGPMIPQQAAAPDGARIGVGRARAGQPNVGAIRAALARKASQAMPENAPSMMKKGGKVKC